MCCSRKFPLVLACLGVLACSSSGPDGSEGEAMQGQSGGTTAVAGTGQAGVSGSGAAMSDGGRSGAAGSAGNTTQTGMNTAASGGTQAPVAGAAAAGTGKGGAGAGAAAAGGTQAPVAGMGAAGQAGMSSSGSGGMSGQASTKELFVAMTGADTNAGSEDMPLATLSAAVAKAAPGMTIWVVGGTYALTETVALKAKGTESEPINIFARSPEARPVLDFKAQARGDSKSRGIEITGDYWHLRGLDVINAGDNCIHIAGAHNTLEWLVTHDCNDTGIQISANSSEASDKTRAANNLILNCDSYANYDQQNQGENADGFAAKLYIGPGNVFRGCRAWNNADDGWDLFASDDVVVIEDCWAIANGKIGPQQNNTNGDGNGFKLGGAAQAGDANMGGAPHEVKHCFSIGNNACGFTRNNNTQTPKLSMCGGRGDAKGLLCSLSGDASAPVTMSAADAIAAKRDAEGKLPAIH